MDKSEKSDPLKKKNVSQRFLRQQNTEVSMFGTLLSVFAVTINFSFCTIESDDLLATIYD